MALTKISGSILKDPLNLGEVSIGGTLTYQDVTNVDSVGIGTFRSGINVSGGQLDVGNNIKIGNTGIITATELDISGDIDVDGHTNLDNVSIAGVSTLGGSIQNSVKILHNSGYGLRVERGGKYIDFNGDWGASGSTAFNAGASGIRFYYGDSSDGIQFNTGSGADKVRITSDGKVGIGTIVTPEKVTILGNVLVKQFAGTDAKLDINESTTTNPLRIMQTATEARIQTIASQPLNIRSQGGSGSNSYLAFWTREDERLRISQSGRINLGDTDLSQNTDQLCVSVSANNAVDNVARFQSAAAASGTSESLVKVYKGAGYGGVISGYITQGSDHGLKFYTANNGALTERLRINKSGHVTMPHLPAFHARPPGHYQLNTGPSDTIIGGTWSTGDPESFAQGSLPSGTSIWNNNTGVFTVPVDGVYSIHWSAFLKNNTERRDAMIYLNGTGSGNIIARTEIQNPSGSTARNKNVSVHTIVHLSATDEIRFGVLSDGSANRLYQNSKPWSYACAALIG